MLNKGFPSKNKVECKFKTNHGVENLVSATAGDDGKVSGVFEETYKYNPYGLSVKGTLESARNFKTEVTVENKLVDHLKTTVAGETDKDAVKLSLEYKQDSFNVQADIDLPPTKDRSITASSVFEYEKFFFGVQGSFSLDKSSLEKANAAISYVNDDFVATLNVQDKGKKLDASYHHKVNSDLAIAANAAVDVDAPAEPKLALVASYKLDGDASTKGRLDTDGRLGLAYSQQLNSFAKLTIATDLNTNSFGNSGDNNNKFGFELALNN